MKNLLKNLIFVMAAAAAITLPLAANAKDDLFTELIKILSNSNGSKMGNCTAWLSSSDPMALVFDLNFEKNGIIGTIQLSSPKLTNGRSLVTKKGSVISYKESDSFGWLVLEVSFDTKNKMKTAEVYKTTPIGKIYKTDISCGKTKSKEI